MPPFVTQITKSDDDNAWPVPIANSWGIILARRRTAVQEQQRQRLQHSHQLITIAQHLGNASGNALP
jgi:hypothetical protein